MATFHSNLQEQINKKKKKRQRSNKQNLQKYKNRKPCSEHTLNKADKKYVKAKLSHSNFQ